ncbi:MAG: hypothetical protein ACE5H9_18220 [Anaerolineae bacterium]
MSPPRISLVPMEGMTRFAPLVALGFFVREYDLLSPIYSRLAFTQASHTQYPLEALLEVWVSMLAGCRSIWQINPKIRPDLVLAQAWGREQFAEQSTVARVLDVCQAQQVDQLRQGVDSIYRQVGPNIKYGRIQTGDLLFATHPAYTPNREFLLSRIQEMDELERAAALFRSHPDYAAPSAFVEGIRNLMDSGQLQLLGDT